MRIVVSLLICALFMAWGQLTTGSITGVVQDPSAAVVPNAKVVLTDVNKGFTYNAETDAAGRYLFRALPPSTYSLIVEATGFATFQRTNIPVEVNSNVSLDVRLELATAAATVLVSDTAAPQLQTQDAATGQVINRQFVNDLPLIGRAVYDLAYLAPGISQPAGSAYGINAANSFIGNNFVSNGGRNAQADILIDGASTTNYEQNTGFTQALYTPGVEDVQEFKIQQTNFSAEFGFSGSTVVNVVTRSGSNAFHGDLFEFFRNDKLNANGFFPNKNGSPRQAYHWNDFGGTFGGPIKKDRVFFFFNTEESRTVTPQSRTLAVPDANERNGDFGILCAAKGGAFSAAGRCSVDAGQIWDPYTAIPDPAHGNPNGGIRQNFIPFNNMATYASPGNANTPWITPGVAGNLINPVARNMMKLLPLPNIGAPGAPGYNYQNNFFGAGSQWRNTQQYDVKVDARITDRDMLSAKLGHNWGKGLNGANLFGANSPLDTNTQGLNGGDVWQSSLNYTRTFSPSTVMVLTGGYIHSWSHTMGNLAGTNFDPSSLGFPSYLKASGFLAVPAINLSAYPQGNGNAAYGTQPWDGMLYGSDVYQLIGTVSHVVGKHEIKAGAEYRVHRVNFTQYGLPAGLFSFNQGSTSQYNNVGGDSMASFMTGWSTGWGAYELPPSPATQNLQYGVFVQDNWRVSDRLTVNVGMRYDVDMPRTERYNRMTYFDPNAASPLATVTSPDCPACANFRGAVQFVGVNGNPRSPYDTYYGAVQPRIGLAYRIGDNTTIRTGYGIYYDPSKQGAAGSGSGSMGFYGFSNMTNYTAYQSDNITPASTISDPFPSNHPIVLPVGSKIGSLALVGNGFSGSAPIRNWNALPQEQSWSFGIQRQLPWGVLIDAEYVGKKGTHLYLGGDTLALDHLPASIADQFRHNPAYWQTQITNPLQPSIQALAAQNPQFISPWSVPLWNGTLPRWSLQLPYPQYVNGIWGAGGLQNVDPPWANSIYHGFQLTANKRFSQGLQFLFTYTFQKSIDNASIAGSNVWVNGTAGGTLASIQDPNNLALERSISQFNITQIAQFSFVYQLPYGKGMHWGANSSALMNGIFGGWQVNGIYRWDSGLPIIVSLNGGVGLPTYGGQRPNLPYALKRASGTNITCFFSNLCGTDPNYQQEITAFTPTPYYDGNAPRVMPNVFAQGTNNISASLFKQFPLRFREGAKLEFRAETFNLFNHVQFGAPNSSIGQSSFGEITSQANNPRVAQLALKLYF